MVITHVHTHKLKSKGQSVPKIKWKQKDRQTDGRVHDLYYLSR